MLLKTPHKCLRKSQIRELTNRYGSTRNSHPYHCSLYVCPCSNFCAVNSITLVCEIRLMLQRGPMTQHQFNDHKSTMFEEVKALILKISFYLCLYQHHWNDCSLSVATPTTLPREQMQSLRHATQKLGPTTDLEMVQGSPASRPMALKNQQYQQSRPSGDTHLV